MRRYLELDLLRTLAILMMVSYHIMFDLNQFYDWSIPINDGPLKLMARVTQVLFLSLVGISAAISYTKMAGKTQREQWKKHLKRFVRIAAVALFITVGTYLMNPQEYIRFGILHLIATSALVLPLCAPLKGRAGILGIIVIILGQFTPFVRVPTSLLLPLGFFPQTGLYTWDYFPLIPWFGIILIGYSIGFELYTQTKASSHKLQDETFSIRHSQFSILTWPGRHALMIYAVHQPIVLLILWLIMGKPDF